MGEYLQDTSTDPILDSAKYWGTSNRELHLQDEYYRLLAQLVKKTDLFRGHSQSNTDICQRLHE